MSGDVRMMNTVVTVNNIIVVRRAALDIVDPGNKK